MRKSPKLDAVRAEVKRLWNLMCEADGIPVDSKFVTFSDSNPFARDYNKVMREYLRLRNARAQRAARKDAIESLGMREVRGALGGRYIE